MGEREGGREESRSETSNRIERKEEEKYVGQFSLCGYFKVPEMKWPLSFIDGKYFSYTHICFRQLSL